MTQKPSYPKRPFRFVWLTFLVFSGLFAVTLPFQDDLPPQKWPLAFGYFLLLPVCSAGLARLGKRVWLLLAAFASVPIILGVIGFVLIFRNSNLGNADTWLRSSIYLFYALGVIAIALSARGWLLYWRDTRLRDSSL